MIIITASNGKLILPAHGSCIDITEDDIVDLSDPKNLSCSIEEFYAPSEYQFEQDLEQLPDQE